MVHGPWIKPFTLSCRHVFIDLPCYASYNQFFGQIPDNIGLISGLQRIDLSMNLLEGKIPSSIGQLRELQYLDLIDNSLDSSIPSELGLFADKSDRFGSFRKPAVRAPSDFGKYRALPECLKNCSALVSGHFEGNKFTGNITNAFGVHPSLEFILLNNNQFVGQLSPHWGQSKNLTVLMNMGKNRSSGSIPSELGQLRQLEYLRLDGNRFTGNNTNAFGIHPSLRFIDLSDNQFVGRLSPQWGKCISITDMRMGRNKISGRIPPELGQLRQLEYLSLDSNEFSGELPDAMGDLFWSDAMESRKTDSASATLFVRDPASGNQNFESFESIILQEEVKFTFAEAVKAVDDFHEKYCIGKGGFGKVYKAGFKSGQVVAVTTINM
ncbi:MDIS1-interacting receptor like kinase 2-like [Pyrus x bretschneideri]|uniref:MDIS1-interacting receptor like kinase 2-like n=1 Tax=Pyrus x bretschneideri TaxID=225117 RepID=UPI00202FE27C|nr:MDIS1-interacting receptor like kinase 2-like [Pyrus x bretschneideri]